MELTEKDRGRTVAVDLDRSVTVRLREQSTAGFQWEIESTGGLYLVDDRYEGMEPAPGAAAIRVFEFLAPHAGRHLLRLRHCRRWIGEESVTDSFEVTVVVRGR